MIDVAIIGFGFMGLTHAVSILKNKRMRLRAIITRDRHGIESKLQQQTGNFSAGEVDSGAILQVPSYTTLRECLRREKLDAVLVCVHTDLHYSIAQEAMENGLHVFLEKPITLRPEEAKLLIGFARQQRLKFMVGHVVRFMPPYKKLKAWIENGEFGKLQFISMTRFSGLPSWGQWSEKQTHFGSSGGALFDLVIHDIDFLNYALGLPEKIECTTYAGSLSVHDYVIATWTYQGMTAKVEGGNIFHSAFPFQAGYMARFERASVVYSSKSPEFIQVCNGEGSSNVIAGDAGEGFYQEIEYFRDCIEHDTDPFVCMPESSLKTLELCYQHL